MFRLKTNKKWFLLLIVTSVTVFFAAHFAEAADTGFFKYKLLEGIPGFFSRGQELTSLPELLSAIYKFGIWTVGIAAMFMIVIGGFTYMTSAGNKASTGSAKGIITDAFLGLAVALLAWLFLYVINPDLTKMNLNLVTVNIEEVKEIEEAEIASTPVSGNLATVNGKQMDASFANALTAINNSGIKTIVTSGLRTLDKQIELIRKNCGGYPPTRACVPATCLLRNGPTSCPHTTGRAIDVWALNSGGKQAISQAQCQSDLQACKDNPYQKALIDAMKKQGFCVLSFEPWHFEKPKMSQACE